MIDSGRFKKSLLRWYGKNKRALPWRQDADPYRVLVSELMLQQTQVKTALPYYEKFLKKFPTAKKLASAPESDVLAAWAGLGYYRRARFLQAAARMAAQGGFPKDAEGLRQLPGVGEYTAAAIGSICFGLPLAVVDGNVIRVMARLLALKADAKAPKSLLTIRAEAARLLDAKRPGDFNQGLMELGALVCTPASPDCANCPVSAQCRALAEGRPEAYPRLAKAPAAVAVRKAAALVRQGSRVLSAPRSRGGRMIGFWHFPELEIREGDEALAQARRLAGLGATVQKSHGALGTLNHSVTRYRIRIEAFHFSATGRPKAPWRWVEIEALKKLPLASAEKRLLAMLERAAA